MNCLIKRITAAACAVGMVVASNAVHAETEKLYEKYSFDEQFEYNSEMIGYALRTTVPKVCLTYRAEITYRPVRLDSEYFQELLLYAYADLSDECSEEGMVMALMDYMEENISDFLTYKSEETVMAENYVIESGIVISEDGYVATNSSVDALSEDDKRELCIKSVESDVVEEIVQTVADVETYGVVLDDVALNSLCDMVLADITPYVEITDEEYALGVCFTTADGNTDLNSCNTYRAEIVETGDAVQGMSILKIDAENLVGLNLLNDYPDADSEIISARYSTDIDDADIKIETGKVKDFDDDSVFVNSKLNAVVLGTYDDIDIGETSKTFLLGLQMLQRDYGKTALECFERVRELQPDTPFIENMIEFAECAPQNESPAQESKNTTKTIIWCTGAVVGVIAVAVSTAIYKKNKKIQKNA